MKSSVATSSDNHDSKHYLTSTNQYKVSFYCFYKLRNLVDQGGFGQPGSTVSQKYFFPSFFLTYYAYLSILSRDGSIPKFQLLQILILEFSCQTIPILEFPNYFQQFDMSGTFISCVHKLYELKNHLPSALCLKNFQTTLFFGFPIFHTSLSLTKFKIVKSVKKNIYSSLSINKLNIYNILRHMSSIQ